MKKDYYIEIDYTNANNVIQSQVLASFVQDITLDDFSLNNLTGYTRIPIPKDFDSWELFYNYCFDNRNKNIFHIKTRWGVTKGICRKRLLPPSLVHFYMNALENGFNQLNNFHSQNIDLDSLINLSQTFTTAYICLNTYIGSYFFNLFYDDYNGYPPDFYPQHINIEQLRHIHGLAYNMNICKNKKGYKRSYNLILREFACKCRYMSFILCLVSFSVCYILPKKITQSIGSFALFMLENFKSINIHHIKVENSDLNVSKQIGERGSTDNTTRIKIYFGLVDGKPLVARLDLPHKGRLDTHINVEDENGETVYNHLELETGEVDYNLLQPLEEALMTFATHEIDWDSSMGKEDDKKILEVIRLERVLFTIAPYEMIKAIIPEGSGTPMSDEA